MAGPPKRGRAKVEVDFAEVEKLAAQGLTEQQICDCLGFSHETLARRKRNHVELREALKRGRAKGLKAVTNALFENATQKKNIVAQIFYLKNRGGWSDDPQAIEKKEAPNIVINVPSGKVDGTEPD